MTRVWQGVAERGLEPHKLSGIIDGSPGKWSASGYRATADSSRRYQLRAATRASWCRPNQVWRLSPPRNKSPAHGADSDMRRRTVTMAHAGPPTERYHSPYNWSAIRGEPIIRVLRAASDWDDGVTTQRRTSPATQPYVQDTSALAVLAIRVSC